MGRDPHADGAGACRASPSSLNGYCEHLKGDLDQPIARGVSTCNKSYSRIWLYDGFHTG